MSVRKDSTVLWLLLGMLALLGTGLFLPPWAVYLLTVALARGLVVLGLLVLWRTGLVSFGQALFYALGGYAAGLLAQYAGIHDALLLLAVALCVPVAAALLAGLLIARYRDIFFAMLTLAFSMILYGVLVKTEALGSTDGFNVQPPTFLGVALGVRRTQLALYALSCVISFLAAAGIHRYLSSPMGHLTTAIRDNEIRVEYLGVSVYRAILVKFALAGALAGAGGGLAALAVGHIDPDMAYWTTSGEFVFVTIFAGIGNVAAPFAGSILFELIRTYAVQYSPYTWQLTLGVVLLLLILFLPNGLWSLFQRRRGRA